MDDQVPVDTLRASFVDELVADDVATALNEWFRWIVQPGGADLPDVFGHFGLDSREYAWRMDEDVDWEFRPHARATGNEVRISVETHDTWQRLSGLLRALGALTVTVARTS